VERVGNLLCGRATYIGLEWRKRGFISSYSHSSWLQIQRSGFDSLRYYIFLEVVGLKWGAFSLVSTIEELLEIKNSGSGLER
jgi:hypothetical protein